MHIGIIADAALTPHPLRTGTVRVPKNRRGSAVLVVLVLLAAMAAIIVANTHTLHALKEELKLLDQRQTQRLHSRPTP